MPGVTDKLIEHITVTTEKPMKIGMVLLCSVTDEVVAAMDS